jgi:replicative DNA helicase
MCTEDDREALDRQLMVHHGPLAFDVAQQPKKLAELACDLEVGTVVLDSLKDVALDLAKDETGSRLTAAFNAVLAEGIELIVLHHHRKATSDNRRPQTIDDVYGSAWITAGAGSVLFLHGRPGDASVKLLHLKQPAGEVGPLTLFVEHETGRVTAEKAVDELDLLRAAPNGITALDVARQMYANSDPERLKADEMRALRRLKALVAKGLAIRREGEVIKGAVKSPALYFAVRNDAS